MTRRLVIIDMSEVERVGAELEKVAASGDFAPGGIVQTVLRNRMDQERGRAVVEVRCDRCAHWGRSERGYAPGWEHECQRMKTLSRPARMNVVGSIPGVFTDADFGCAMFEPWAETSENKP